MRPIRNESSVAITFEGVTYQPLPAVIAHDDIDAALAKCPACGNLIRDRSLRWSAADRTLMKDGWVVTFSKLESRLFDAVFKNRNKGVWLDREQMAHLIYFDDVNGGPTAVDVSISQFVHRVRKKIKPFKLSISVVLGRSGGGYRLVEDC